MGGIGVTADIELSPERYVLFQGEAAVFGPLRDLPKALDAAARRAAAARPAAPPIAPPRVTARSWVTTLLILAGTLALIAAATLVSLRMEGQRPPQKLDTIPPMPGGR